MKKLLAFSGPIVMLVVFGTAALSARPLSGTTAGWLFVGAVTKPVLAAIARSRKVRASRLDSDPSWSPLHHAVNDGQRDTMLELIGLGSDLDVQDAHGTTPLHIAVQVGNRAFMAELIRCGADAGTVDATGSTTLVMALVRHNLDLVGPLLEAGANPDRANEMGMSARSLAVEMMRPDLIPERPETSQ